LTPSAREGLHGLRNGPIVALHARDQGAVEALVAAQGRGLVGRRLLAVHLLKVRREGKLKPYQGGDAAEADADDA